MRRGQPLEISAASELFVCRWRAMSLDHADEQPVRHAGVLTGMRDLTSKDVGAPDVAVHKGARRTNRLTPMDIE
jgi:hypothetical protein